MRPIRRLRFLIANIKYILAGFGALIIFFAASSLIGTAFQGGVVEIYSLTQLEDLERGSYVSFSTELVDLGISIRRGTSESFFHFYAAQLDGHDVLVRSGTIISDTGIVDLQGFILPLSWYTDNPQFAPQPLDSLNLAENSIVHEGRSPYILSVVGLIAGAFMLFIGVILIKFKQQPSIVD